MRQVAKWLFKHVSSWKVTIFILVLFMLVEGRFFFPLPSYWLTVNSIVIENSVPGESIFLDVDRTIKREFSANWVVTLTSASTNRVVCISRGSDLFKENQRLPDPTELSSEDCPSTLPKGAFKVTALWTLFPPSGFFGSREVIAESNIFRIE